MLGSHTINYRDYEKDLLI